VLVLSLDSLIAAVALSAAVRPRHYATLALMFGLCDLAASSVTPVLGAHLAASGLAPVLDAWVLELVSVVPWLLLLGILMLSAPARRAHSPSSSFAAYLMPPVFALDNLIFPTASPVLAGLLSCAMAAAGFVLGWAVLQRMAPPAARPVWAAGLAAIALALQLAG
jgi:hypothetical protein